jgi:tRNA A-37 threonylcarbamoyl transferase component Bud32
MNRERWRQVKGLLALALEQPPEHRRAFLTEAAADDADLLGELTSLMDAHDRPEGFSLERNLPLMTSWEPLDADRAGSYSKICSRCHSRYGPLIFVCPQDGEPLADDPEALIGVTLDGLYAIEELVGHGAMGRVYRARHELLRDLVAIKVLRSDFARDEDFVRRFMREGRAARAIHHPNAVTVHDLRTTADGLTYMVQEYIDGHTLRDEMDERMTLAEALGYLEPVAAALDEAHAHGVVHRDLKPENIMIGTAGGRPVVKLTDLGIAKLFDLPGEPVEAHTDLTIPGQVMGTPHYMSPEQWGAAPDDGGPDIDPRADVYSFGVIAYELLAGRKPFDVGSVRQRCLSHLSRETPDLRQVAPELPEAVSAAVARALSKERDQRQASCGELVAELKAAAAPPLAAPPARGIPWWALAAIVVAIGLVAALYVPSHEPRPVAPVVAPPAVPARAFDCVAEVQKFRGGRAVKAPMVVSTDRTLLVEAGDRVRFTLADPREGFVYVLNETVQSNAGASDMRVLFPVSWARGGSARVAAGEALTLPPDATTWIEFDEERGTEAFWIVWSADAVPALEEIRADDANRGVLDAARARSVRDLLTSIPRASTEADPATGRTTVRGDAAVVHRVEIQHY